jgi:hypothetical protein
MVDALIGCEWAEPPGLPPEPQAPPRRGAVRRLIVWIARAVRQFGPF